MIKIKENEQFKKKRNESFDQSKAMFSINLCTMSKAAAGRSNGTAWLAFRNWTKLNVLLNCLAYPFR